MEPYTSDATAAATAMASKPSHRLENREAGQVSMTRNEIADQSLLAPVDTPVGVSAGPWYIDGERHLVRDLSDGRVQRGNGDIRSVAGEWMPPLDPEDPEAAALDLIVRLPVDVLGRVHLREILQELSLMLGMAGAFTGLSWTDAKFIVGAIITDGLSRDDAGEFLRFRASAVRSGRSGVDWDDPQSAARALAIAARVMDQ